MKIQQELLLEDLPPLPFLPSARMTEKGLVYKITLQTAKSICRISWLARPYTKHFYSYASTRTVFKNLNANKSSQKKISYFQATYDRSSGPNTLLLTSIQIIHNQSCPHRSPHHTTQTDYLQKQPQTCSNCIIAIFSLRLQDKITPERPKTKVQPPCPQPHSTPHS